MIDRLTNGQRVQKGLAKRHAAEKRFKLYGAGSVALALGFLVLMLGGIVKDGVGAFRQTHIRLEVHFDEADMAEDDWQGMVKESLRVAFPNVTKRSEKKALYGLISSGAGFDLKDMAEADPALAGRTVPVWLVASDDVDQLIKGHIRRDVPEGERRVSDREIAWIEALETQGAVERKFNARFFTSGDSREPELAGILGAAMGSFLSLAICFALSFPLGVMTAVYLEEFAPKNRWTDLIEVNINNLAAVPSIVFGLLGLAMFLSVMGLPRSSPLVGGLVLALMTLPTIIIASRAALRAVPPSIRQAALGLGANEVQVVGHHVLPLALPGMLTGAIIGMAQALGETAPLLMIGMVAFIVDIPGSVLEPATALPVQIFLWADAPERAFTERTAAAILVLLAFLIVMNLTAVLLRKRFEVRW